AAHLVGPDDETVAAEHRAREIAVLAALAAAAGDPLAGAVQVVAGRDAVREECEDALAVGDGRRAAVAEDGLRPVVREHLLVDGGHRLLELLFDVALLLLGAGNR